MLLTPLRVFCILDFSRGQALISGVTSGTQIQTVSPTGPPGEPLGRSAPPAAKIALFRSLFRGREDVYARRFVSRRTGQSGYQPACANEWVRGLCDKPRTKCSECPNRRFLPMTDEVVYWHLSGRDAKGQEFVMGMYPMLLDETCYFVAIDFDGDDWQADTSAFLESCRRVNVPAALERSRSGNGGHVWLFFTHAIPASLARKLGSLLITDAMERRPDMGLRSYDRLFPNQDTMPKGGLGNLIALPLQQRPRDQGNSVFLDARFRPHEDQWTFLSSIERVSRMHAESLACEAEGRGRIVGVRFSIQDPEDDAPWTAPPSRRRVEAPIAGPLPPNLDLVLADQVYIAREGLPPALRNRLIRLAAFQNPEFYRAQAMRLPTYDKPRVISCAETLPQHVGLPRGCIEDIQDLLKSLGIKSVVRDERACGKPLDVSFCGELRPEQQAAAEAMLAHDMGVLAATTAFGKTVLAAWLIARRGVNTLVLLHRQQLMEQWIERLSTFLGLPAKTIGRLGGGRHRLSGVLDVALMQSLVRNGVVDDRVANYGHLVVDECHHLSARSFELVARRAKPKFVTGLSATVSRKDGHHPIIFMQCGPVRYRVDARQQAAARPFTHQVIVRPTGFRMADPLDTGQRAEFQKLCAALSASPARNRMIVEDVVGTVRAGRFPLLLTERTDHLRALAETLRAELPDVIILQGGMGRRALGDALAQIAEAPGGVGRVLLATGRFIGEGFDDPRLDTLFLALPVSWRGTIAQYVGRLHRLHEDKKEVRVYDYVDLDVPMLARMFDRRCRGYEAAGYTILLPASALPGWPADVPLPIDPQWKQDYAASVHRLVRDGVDASLGHLFVGAARTPTPNAEGSERARSACEAFLYRRLQTVEETRGCFQLNARLPVACDGRSEMEVDFLCEAAQVVIELDGGQHLSDAEAYRRDRKRDALLQENGYFVLRFLAEDLSKRLGDVLDTILRTLAHQRRFTHEQASNQKPS